MTSKSRSFSDRASDIVFTRNTNPLLQNDLLFNLSSVGKLQARNLVTMNAMCNKILAERQQLLKNNGECLVRPGDRI
jgi:hypothetical protein